MADAEETVWVVFNGEIYNFHELRRELESPGHVFRTRSDTEVIVHGYKQWGTEVLNRLNGMFGLAIWDDRRKRLVIARDSAGIKLVYYHVDGRTVSFGSELRAVLAGLSQRPDIDVGAVNLFLRYRYTPSPLTLHQGVRKLAPGTMAVFENGDWRVERWYRFRPTPFSPALTDDEASGQLLDIYKRALKRHLISDVPVGLLLSGGVDSGLLLGLMNLYGDTWPTYTVGYGKAAYKDDELADAAETAALFSSRNTSVTLSRETFERRCRRSFRCSRSRSRRRRSCRCISYASARGRTSRSRWSARALTSSSAATSAISACSTAGTGGDCRMAAERRSTPAFAACRGRKR